MEYDINERVQARMNGRQHNHERRQNEVGKDWIAFLKLSPTLWTRLVNNCDHSSWQPTNYKSTVDDCYCFTNVILCYLPVLSLVVSVGYCVPVCFHSCVGCASTLTLE